MQVLNPGSAMLSKNGVLNMKKFMDHLMKRTTDYKSSDKTYSKLNNSMKKVQNLTTYHSMNSLISLKKNSKLSSSLLISKRLKETKRFSQLKTSQNQLTGLKKAL